MGRIRTTRQAKFCRVEALRLIAEEKRFEATEAAMRAAAEYNRQTEVLRAVLKMQGIQLQDPEGNTEGLPKLEAGQSVIINRYGDTEVVDTGEVPKVLPVDSIVVRRPKHGGA